jgi:hypothetical protein
MTPHDQTFDTFVDRRGHRLRLRDDGVGKPVTLGLAFGAFGTE